MEEVERVARNGRGGEPKGGGWRVIVEGRPHDGGGGGPGGEGQAGLGALCRPVGPGWARAKLIPGFWPDPGGRGPPKANPGTDRREALPGPALVRLPGGLDRACADWQADPPPRCLSGACILDLMNK